MGSIYVICSRQCPNGDGIYTLLNALYKYSTSITNQPTNQGRFCVRVCSLFVCNWRAKFKQNIIVLCICRHDMVAIMMSNPGLSNKFDVDPLSNSDSKMSNSLFSRGRLITLPRSACLDLRGECFKCRSKIPAHPLRLWMEVTHFGGHGWYSSFRIPNVNN